MYKIHIVLHRKGVQCVQCVQCTLYLYTLWSKNAGSPALDRSHALFLIECFHEKWKMSFTKNELMYIKMHGKIRNTLINILIILNLHCISFLYNYFVINTDNVKNNLLMLYSTYFKIYSVLQTKLTIDFLSWFRHIFRFNKKYTFV